MLCIESFRQTFFSLLSAYLLSMRSRQTRTMAPLDDNRNQLTANTVASPSLRREETGKPMLAWLYLPYKQLHKIHP